MFYTAGRRRPGKRTGRCRRFSRPQNWPPTLFNTAFYSNPQVDKDLNDALKTTDAQEKRGCIRTRRILSGKSRRGCRWWSKNWSQHSKKSDRFYIQPDTGFSFEQADLK